MYDILLDSLYGIISIIIKFEHCTYYSLRENCMLITKLKHVEIIKS